MFSQGFFQESFSASSDTACLHLCLRACLSVCIPVYLCICVCHRCGNLAQHMLRHNSNACNKHTSTCHVNKLPSHFRCACAPNSSHLYKQHACKAVLTCLTWSTACAKRKEKKRKEKKRKEKKRPQMQMLDLMNCRLLQLLWPTSLCCG